MKKIIDVSYHNGRIDWQKVKASGEISAAIIRCGYGDDIKTQDDKMFTANIEACINIGIPVGVYIYSYATTIKQTESEANHVIRLCEKYKDKLSLPIYYDLEQKGTEKGASKRASIFIDILTARGYEVGIYANLHWWQNYLKDVKCNSKWVARYNKIKPDINGLDIWQYSDAGKVAGITGAVDVNYCYRDFNIKANNSNTTAPTTEKKSNAEIAAEVLAGKWGNGVYRKNKLTEAGYNYNEIQKIVNEIISPKLEVYTVKKGDSLWKIAEQKLGNPKRWAEIKTLNGLQTDLIYVGQRLKLPK